MNGKRSLGVAGRVCCARAMAAKGGLEVEKPRSVASTSNPNRVDDADLEALGATGTILAVFSFILVILFFPFSLVGTVKVRACSFGEYLDRFGRWYIVD